MGSTDALATKSAQNNQWKSARVLTFEGRQLTHGDVIHPIHIALGEDKTRKKCLDSIILTRLRANKSIAPNAKESQGSKRLLQVLRIKGLQVIPNE